LRYQTNHSLDKQVFFTPSAYPHLFLPSHNFAAHPTVLSIHTHVFNLCSRSHQATRPTPRTLSRRTSHSALPSVGWERLRSSTRQVPLVKPTLTPHVFPTKRKHLHLPQDTSSPPILDFSASCKRLFRLLDGSINSTCAYIHTSCAYIILSCAYIRTSCA